MSVCYISRCCFSVAFEIFNVQFYSWDATLWRWHLLTQQIISAWIFSLISAYVRLSAAFHYYSAVKPRWVWGSYPYPWVHMSLQHNPALEHLRKRSGTWIPVQAEACISHTAQQSEKALPAQRSDSLTSWAASWASNSDTTYTCATSGKVMVWHRLKWGQHLHCKSISCVNQKEVKLRRSILQNPDTYRRLLNQV